MTTRRRPHARKASPSPSSASPTAQAAFASSSAISPALGDASALLAAFEARPKRAKRSSSERSKEFRNKRKMYEQELSVAVAALQSDVSELSVQHRLVQEQRQQERRLLAVHPPHAMDPRRKLVREYGLVFQHGCAPLDDEYRPSAASQYQRDFLLGAMASDVQVGGSRLNRGVDAILDHWRWLTASHSGVFVQQTGDVVVRGPVDDPVVVLCATLHARISSATLAMLFPGADAQPELARAFVDRTVTYDCRSYFRFSPHDGRVVTFDSELELISGLLRIADVRLADVTALMRYAVSTRPDGMPDRVRGMPMTQSPTLSANAGSSQHQYPDSGGSGKRIGPEDVEMETEVTRPVENLRQTDRRKLQLSFVLC